VSNINAVALAGNLTRDPELRWTPSGTAVCNLGLAVNRSRKDGDEWVDVPSFFDITVFAGRGELCARKLSKGDQVFVQGRLEQQRWENQEGEKRSKVVVIAEQVEGPAFFAKGNVRETADAQGEATAAPAPAAGQQDDIPF
jgi:single-strand DNA-binding protein